jgi:ketosteroid isomerase-like protein
MQRYFYFLAVLICGCSAERDPRSTAEAHPAGRDVAADSAAIVRLEHEFAEAILRRDSSTMNRIVADEFAGLVSPEGYRFGKREVLANFTNPKVSYESWTVDSLQVRVAGNLAIVTGFDVNRGRNSRGPFTASSRFMETFVWRDGRWQDWAGHYARLPTR